MTIKADITKMLDHPNIEDKHLELLAKIIGTIHTSKQCSWYCQTVQGSGGHSYIWGPYVKDKQVTLADMPIPELPSPLTHGNLLAYYVDLLPIANKWVQRYNELSGDHVVEYKRMVSNSYEELEGRVTDVLNALKGLRDKMTLLLKEKPLSSKLAQAHGDVFVRPTQLGH